MKLAAVRERMAAIEPRWSQLPLVEANVEDPGWLRRWPADPACYLRGGSLHLPRRAGRRGMRRRGDRLRRPHGRGAVRRPDVAALPRAGATQRRADRPLVRLDRPPHHLGTRTRSTSCRRASRSTLLLHARFERALRRLVHIGPRQPPALGADGVDRARRARLERGSAGRRARLTSRLPALPAHLSGWRLPYPTLDRQTAVHRPARSSRRADFRYGQFFLFEQLAPRAALAALATHRRSGEARTPSGAQRAGSPTPSSARRPAVAWSPR